MIAGGPKIPANAPTIAPGIKARSFLSERKRSQARKQIHNNDERTGQRLALAETGIGQ